MESCAELGKEILSVSPYALFVVFAFIVAYLMFKVSVDAIHKQSEKALEEMRKAYDSALNRVINSEK